MIHHVTAWETGNIGGGLNAAIDPLPANAMICVRDGDTLFLSPDWGRQIEKIVSANRGYDLIGCMTNRLRAPYQLHEGQISNEDSITQHRLIAEQRWRAHGTEVRELAQGPVAAMLMIFPKAVWLRHPFPERSIYFDQQFTQDVRDNGGRVGIAQGFYLFHLYRWGQPNPTAYTEHLRHG